MELSEKDCESLQNLWYILDKLGAANVHDILVDKWYHSGMIPYWENN